MSMNVAEVEQALLALDQHDRAAVIHRGLRSLDADDANSDTGGIGETWRAELRRRIDATENGTIELVDAEESHARLRSELVSRRR